VTHAPVDLLVLSEVRWGYFRTRKQFLLSRFPDHWRVFFAQPPGDAEGDAWTPRQEGNVTWFTVPFLKPGTRNPIYNAMTANGVGRGVIERAAGAHLQRMIARLGIARPPVVLTSNIYAAHALSGLAAQRVFYDFNDSPHQFSTSPRWAREYWQRTRDQVDLFFVVSEHYRRELSRETDRPLVLLGNGVEWERFARPAAPPAALRDLPRPRIGYLGLLSHFLDFDTLEALRQARGRGVVTLVGPGSPATAASLAEFARRDGVRVLDAVPYEQVPAVMQSFDVGVIPFRAGDPHVAGINPNKVYQYLAAGIPVVTTPILDLTPDPPALTFARDPGEMAAAVGAALAARSHPEDARRLAERCRALARPHDWSVLASRMVSTIEERLAA
jgi:glycosyltransferase involved in cell wall biosynthesis